jgi:hypothetical protein
MKKYLVAGAIILSMAGIQFAYANIIYTPPEGKQYVQPCLLVRENHPIPQFTIFLRMALNSRRGPPIPPTVTVVNFGDCIYVQEDASYDLYALDATYAKTLDIRYYDPADDPKAYKANLQIQMPSFLVDADSGIEYQHMEYFVDSVNTSTKQLILIDGGVVTNRGMTFPTYIILIILIIFVMLGFWLWKRRQ